MSFDIAFKLEKLRTALIKQITVRPFDDAGGGAGMLKILTGAKKLEKSCGLPQLHLKNGWPGYCHKIIKLEEKQIYYGT